MAYSFDRTRYYNPMFGRFVSQDPIGFAGGINKYSYAANNPTTFTDPGGKSLCPIHYTETYIAFMKVFGDDALASAAGWAVCAEDVGTQKPSVRDTRRHAMAGRKDNGQQQNQCQAYESTRDFVNNTRDPFAAIHAIQESYSGSHEYQAWTGKLTLAHVRADAVYQPGAEAATEQYSRDLLGNRLKDASAYLYPTPCR